LLDVDLSWLLGGEGVMNSVKPDSVNIFNRKDVIRLDEIVHLREISHVAAGTFASLLTIDDEPIMHAVPVNLLPSGVRKLSLAEIARKYFIFIVKGNSMYPRIHEGDQLVVERVESFEQVAPGNIIIAINEDDQIIVKRLKKKNSHFVLESDNPDFSDIEMELDIRAVGKVVKIMADV
jgi:phage repressor protein C with HTH and peptisase S24 domain